MTNQSNRKRRVLVVEDGLSEREALARMLRVERFEVVTAASAEDALAQQDQSLDLVISDLRMLQQSGVDLLRTWRQRHPSMPFILLTAYGAIDAAVEAMKLGASDFLTKPVEPPRLLRTIRQLLDASPVNTATDRGISGFERIVGESPLILDACQRTLRAAQSNSTVLLMGESGTGKELFAEAIHRHSARSQQPFVVVNMAAIPDSLVESELFGHVKGSFTGAWRPAPVASKRLTAARCSSTKSATSRSTCKPNCCVPWNPPRLRRLEVKSIGALSLPQVVAATSRPLLAMKNAGTFREDLYYRLNVLTLHLPPLRDRRQDIPLLVHHFLQPRAADGGSRPLLVSPELMQHLQSYDWPGNVRQLKNCLEWMRVMNSNGRLGLSDLPVDLQPSIAEAPSTTGRMNSIERAAILEALDQFGGNRVHAARLLGISIRTLQRRLRDWDSGAQAAQATEA